MFTIPSTGILVTALCFTACGADDDASIEPWASDVFEVAMEGAEDLRGAALIDHLSAFTFGATSHLDDTYFRGTDVRGMFQYLDERMNDPSSEVRSFQCGDRAQVLRVLLIKAGMQARLVNLYTDVDSTVLTGHILVEVLSSESAAWELIDPDFDVFYARDGHRIGLAEAVQYGPERFLPCDESGCSWALENEEGVRPAILRDSDYFQAGYQYTSEEQTPLVHISDRFDASMVFEDRASTLLDVFADAGIPVVRYSTLP